MKKSTKCEKCDAEATVYFSVISGKGRASRKQYCKPCALLERFRIAPQVIKQEAQQASLPATNLGLVQQEMEKSVCAPEAGEKTAFADDTPEAKVQRLERLMAAAVAKEDYEKAAKIRDKIVIIQSSKR